MQPKSQFFYNGHKVRELLTKAMDIQLEFCKSKNYAPNFNFLPEELKNEVYGLCWNVFAEMYGYFKNEIRKADFINEEDREDFLQSLYWGLFNYGRGFFREAKFILNRFDRPMEYRKKEVHRYFHKILFTCYKSFQRREATRSVFYEEDLDLEFLEYIHGLYVLDPEPFVINKEFRHNLVDRLLTAPRDCRIDIKIYEVYVKVYFMQLFGFKIENCNQFYLDYVKFSIRKLLYNKGFDIDDFKRKRHDYGESFAEILGDRLGIPRNQNIFSEEYKCNESKYKQSIESTKSYDRNAKELFFYT